MDEHDEGSIGVEEEVDEVVPHREGGRQVCKSEAHSRPVKEKAGGHTLLQATYTGVRTTVLGDIFFLLFLAETK